MVYSGHDFSDFIHPRACKRCKKIGCYCTIEGQRVIEECEELPWPIEYDPRTKEEMLLDEWQATVDDVRSLLLGC